MNLEHDRCSELLGPLLRGELSEQEARSVEEHIAGCEECRAEKRGLEALLAAPEVMKVSAEALSEIERARLRRAIADAIPASRTIVSEPRKPWAARIAPYLGTAAVLVLIVFGVTQLQLGGSDGDESAESAGAPVQNESNRAADESGAGEDSSGGAATELDQPEPAPSFEQHAGVIHRTSLRSFASKEEPFTNFAENYDAADAERLVEPYLKTLATGAEATGESDLITECGNQVLSAQDNPTLPAYAGWAELEKRDVLMMGFVYTPDDSGPLDRFLLWIWPRGTCGFPTESQSGRIKP